MATIRQQKVGMQIQRKVAEVLLREIGDPRVDGLVSITRVDVTPDLREARVHVSVLGGKRRPGTVLEGIRSAGRHIQTQVAEGLSLRYAPRLSFHLDDSLKRESELLKKIDEANRGDEKHRSAQLSDESRRPGDRTGEGEERVKGSGG